MKLFVASLRSGTGIITPPVDVYGCTNPLALNYNPLATVDDGSCVYQVILEPPTDIFLEELTTDVEGTFEFTLPFILY